MKRDLAGEVRTYLHEHDATAREVASAMRCSLRAAHAHIASLREEGVIVFLDFCSNPKAGGAAPAIYGTPQ